MAQPLNLQDAIFNLQKYLRAISFADTRVSRPPLDGIFDTATEDAVRSFQSSRGMNANGLVDRATWDAIYEEYKALAYWSRLLETLMERKPSLMGFFQKSKGYYSKEKGFLIKVSGEFAASLIAGPDISLTLKTLLSEFEGRNILNEPFTVLSDAKVKNEAIHIIDELEELIGQSE